ncbi:uncharacterized protein TNCV_986651 [Trichonephila clavipes]|uniref:Uncharacterized protein n=1 Tax=Trichonephila clavipes TaxID=2585209 RepID=A0A8X6SVX2_TRICX|nr:uncharacterized protein TNCV_986651 [Trichonephila clavipes]
MDNICLKCGGVHFGAEKNARRVYTRCCHNGKIAEEASTYPAEMNRLIYDGHDLSQHFKNIRWYNSAMLFASMGAQIVPRTVEEHIALEFMARFITGLLIYIQFKQEKKTFLSYMFYILSLLLVDECSIVKIPNAIRNWCKALTRSLDMSTLSQPRTQ